jgi:putative flavoprotein involved in K+ transport
MGDPLEDLIIVGAGAAGLCAAWYGKEAGLNPLILEQNSKIGGAWRHMPEDMTCLSPARFDRFPDGTSPATGDAYAKAPDVLAALISMHGAFSPRVELSTPVEAVSRGDDCLEVKTASKTVETRRLIVASGIYGRPHIPELSGQFDGRSLHSRQLSSHTFSAGERVLLVGSGNSASEALETLLRAEVRVVLAHRSRVEAPHGVDYKGLVGRLRWWASGIPVRFMPSGGGCRDHTPVVRSILFDATRDGRVEVIDEVLSLYDRGANTRSGARVEVDTIIWATGFKRDTTWLSELLTLDESGWPKHKEGVSLEDPRVGFVGLPCQRTRRSAFLRGFANDAKYVINRLK